MTTEQVLKMQDLHVYKAIAPYAPMSALGAIASTQTYTAIVDHLRPMGA